MNLRHYSEFKEILEKYRVSEHAQEVLKKLTLVLMLAPTSAGRNTIIRYKVGTGRYYYIVSDTTRPSRINDGVPEKNGREYWFRSEEDMLEDLRAGEFLEAEIIHDQQVSGVSIRELEKAVRAHKIAITDIDIKGMHNIKRAKPDTFAILLIPPTFDEWQRRLSGRGHMPPQEQKRRLQTARLIFDDALKQDYYQFVISENVEQSAAIVDAIVAGKPNPHQGRGRDVIEHLRSRLEDKLNSIY